MRKDEPKGEIDCIHYRTRDCNILKALYCAKEEKPCKFFDTEHTWGEKVRRYGEKKE